MGVKTGIEWTDATWNPIRGCTRVSEGCRHCYAETQAHRFSGPGGPYEGLTVLKNGHPSWTGAIRFVEEHLLDPMKWKTPRRIFVNSMSDLFHENVIADWIVSIFAVMGLTPHHTYQILTKRPHNMQRLLTDTAFIGRLADRIEQMRTDKPRRAVGPLPHLDGGEQWFPLANVWLGVSVENQATADVRIPLLLQTPAAVRFISAEPLLGDVNIPEYVYLPRAIRSELPFPPFMVAKPGVHAIKRNPHGAVSTLIDGQLLGLKPDEFELLPTLDWVICGGESGPGARPMLQEWPRSLRDQCVAAGVPFFFKQWGQWAPTADPKIAEARGVPLDQCMSYVGKHKAGSMLDGQEWKQFPEKAGS